MLSLYVPGGSWIPQGVRGKSVFQKALPLAPYSSQQRSDMCGGGDWNSKEHPKKPNKPRNLNQIRTKTKNPNLGNTSEKPKICCTPSGGVQSSPTKGISKDWTPLLYLVCHVELCAIFFFSYRWVWANNRGQRVPPSISLIVLYILLLWGMNVINFKEGVAEASPWECPLNEVACMGDI